MIHISKEQVIFMHNLLINESGGTDGIRDEALLESAINAPFHTFAGDELYPSIPKKAAVFCYSLINNHAFIDGNKRIGILVMLTFLDLNGINVICNDNELIQLGLDVASSQIKQDDITKWIIEHI